MIGRGEAESNFYDCVYNYFPNWTRMCVNPSLLVVHTVADISLAGGQDDEEISNMWLQVLFLHCMLELPQLLPVFGLK